MELSMHSPTSSPVEHHCESHDATLRSPHELFMSQPLVVESYKEFLNQPDHVPQGSITNFATLSIAFGIAGSVLAGALGAAFKYISSKVDEEKSKMQLLLMVIFLLISFLSLTSIFGEQRFLRREFIAPITPGMGPAPSAVNVQGAMNPALPVSANTAPVCTPPVVTAPVPGAPAPVAPTGCVSGASSSPPANDSTGQIVGYAMGGLFALITIAAIAQKYKTMGSYSSFWGRMLCLLSGAAAMANGYSDYSAHSANECNNFMGDPMFTSPCPCLGCAYMMFGYAAFQFCFNLPFLYANDKTISKMYASFGLFNQASLMFMVSGGVAAAIKFGSGSIISMCLAALGCLAAVMFMLGWFKGEDGVLSRMFQSAKDMLSDATTAATVMVDDGLKMFGLNADERTKLTLQNIYTFVRVGRGPDWSAGEEGLEGEVVGFIGENGVVDGVPLTVGKSGWAKVKWDPPVPGQPAKSGEYRIGADGKFELKLLEESEGVVDKLMSQTFGLFGYAPEKNSVGKEKLQIEFVLSYKLPGEEDDGAPDVDLQNDGSDDDEGVNKKALEKAKAAATAAAAAASKDMLVLTCDVFNANGKFLDKCDELKPMLFKSAIRHRPLGKKQDAIVIELQKLPPDAAIMALSVKVPEGKKLSHWDSFSLKATSTGHDIPKLSLSPTEGAVDISSHQSSQGYLLYIMYLAPPLTPVQTPRWFADKINTNLGSSDTAGMMVEQVEKFLSKRELKKKKKDQVFSKDISGLVDIDEVFENLKFEIRCETQAKELMNAKMEATTRMIADKLKAQGQPESVAQMQGKKLALIQINKQHQATYQQTLALKRAFYLKNRVPPMLAIKLATADAKRAALYDGKEAEVKQSVKNSIAEEKEAVEEAKKLQDADYANTLTGQASAIGSSLWGWAGATEEVPKKKKKKRKEKEEEPLIAPAPQTLPPQFANMTPQQLAALRAMQQRQNAAKSTNP